MADPIRSLGAQPITLDIEESPVSSSSTGNFREVLRQTETRRVEETATLDGIRRAASSLVHGERFMDRTIAAANRGRVFSNEELLAVQVGVYRYTQELELASKLIDKATGAVRQTLQSQQ